MSDMKTVSLFSGAGGLDVGARLAGLDVVWANDSNKDACDTYSRNLGSHVRLGLLKQHWEELGELSDVEAVIGGPPCQGFSVTGKMEPTDPRSQLVFLFLDVVEMLTPRFFVMENVKGLAALSKFSKVRERLIQRSTNMGYGVTLVVLNSKDYGCPTARQRMFLVGFQEKCHLVFESLAGEGRQREIPSLEVFNVLGPEGTGSNPKTCNAGITLLQNPILRKSPYAGMLLNGRGRPSTPRKPCAALPAAMGGNATPVVDENQIWGDGSSWIEEYHRHLLAGGGPYKDRSTPNFLRRLTLREAAALQTFPEGFEFSGSPSSIYKQIGNSVPCRLAQHVFECCMEVFK
jgi:DNA (cytosine-5)-methyltransferase 1